MTYLETIKSQNCQIYPEDPFSHVAAHLYVFGKIHQNEKVKVIVTPRYALQA